MVKTADRSSRTRKAEQPLFKAISRLLCTLISAGSLLSLWCLYARTDEGQSGCSLPGICEAWWQPPSLWNLGQELEVWYWPIVLKSVWIHRRPFKRRCDLCLRQTNRYNFRGERLVINLINVGEKVWYKVDESYGADWVQTAWLASTLLNDIENFLLCDWSEDTEC